MFSGLAGSIVFTAPSKLRLAHVLALRIAISAFSAVKIEMENRKEARTWRVVSLSLHGSEYLAQETEQCWNIASAADVSQIAPGIWGGINATMETLSK